MSDVAKMECPHCHGTGKIEATPQELRSHLRDFLLRGPHTQTDVIAALRGRGVQEKLARKTIEIALSRGDVYLNARLQLDWEAGR